MEVFDSITLEEIWYYGVAAIVVVFAVISCCYLWDVRDHDI